MPTDLPHYYSSLAPFVDTFRSGLPILTYHHVGPRPRGARLKGLYVSPQLFARQMRELAESGFITTGLPVGESAGESGHTVTAPKTIWLVRRRGEDTAPYPGQTEVRGRGEDSAPYPGQTEARRRGEDSAPYPGQTEARRRGGDTAPYLGRTEQVAIGDGQVCVTFDDGFVDVFNYALPVLVEQRFMAIEYLVPNLLGKTNEWQQRAGDVSEPLMDDAQVREWLSAGQEIGSHTLAHPWLTRIPVDRAREEITASKKALEDKFGVSIRHFCYPYGDYNAAVRDLVAEAGYATACTTQTGLNLAGASPFELKRFTARYASRNLKQLWARLRSRWFGS